MKFVKKPSRSGSTMRKTSEQYYKVSGEYALQQGNDYRKGKTDETRCQCEWKWRFY